MIDAETARELLRYDPLTGKLHWLVNRRNGTKAGDVAGTLVKEGYVSVVVCQKAYFAHRLAWLLQYGNWPSISIDHINGDRADNRWANLRAANQTQQNANSAIRKDNTTGYRGVARLARHPRGKPYRASICVAGKQKTLGWYVTAEEAAAVYDRAAEAAFGDFRRAA